MLSVKNLMVTIAVSRESSVLLSELRYAPFFYVANRVVNATILVGIINSDHQVRDDLFANGEQRILSYTFQRYEKPHRYRTIVRGFTSSEAFVEAVFE